MTGNLEEEESEAFSAVTGLVVMVVVAVLYIGSLTAAFICCIKEKQGNERSAKKKERPPKIPAHPRRTGTKQILEEMLSKSKPAAVKREEAKEHRPPMIRVKYPIEPRTPGRYPVEPRTSGKYPVEPRTSGKGMLMIDGPSGDIESAYKTLNFVRSPIVEGCSSESIAHSEEYDSLNPIHNQNETASPSNEGYCLLDRDDSRKGKSTEFPNRPPHMSRSREHRLSLPESVLSTHPALNSPGFNKANRHSVHGARRPLPPPRPPKPAQYHHQNSAEQGQEGSAYTSDYWELTIDANQETTPTEEDKASWQEPHQYAYAVQIKSHPPLLPVRNTRLSMYDKNLRISSPYIGNQKPTVLTREISNDYEDIVIDEVGSPSWRREAK